jgi:hypothetical protein
MQVAEKKGEKKGRRKKAGTNSRIRTYKGTRNRIARHSSAGELGGQADAVVNEIGGRHDDPLVGRTR